MFDRDTLLVIGGLLLTSRAWKGAVFGWISDLYQTGKWIRRRALDEVFTRLGSLEERMDEHETDSGLHPSLVGAVAPEDHLPRY